MATKIAMKLQETPSTLRVPDTISLQDTTDFVRIPQLMHHSHFLQSSSTTSITSTVIMVQCLQLSFTMAKPKEEDLKDLAHKLAQVKGLQSKCWTYNEKDGLCGGFYTFSDSESLQEYLHGPIVADLRKLPNFKEQVWDMFQELSAITNCTVGKTSD